jgi:hypothetical protein
MEIHIFDCFVISQIVAEHCRLGSANLHLLKLKPAPAETGTGFFF